MKEYKIYGGLKYLVHDGKKPVFKFICYQEEKKKTTIKKKKYRRVTRRRRNKLITK